MRQFAVAVHPALHLCAFLCAIAIVFFTLAPVSSQETPTTIVLHTGTAWLVPTDWNNSGNTVDVIGGGSGGGGGGAYAHVSNVILNPGETVGYVVGGPSQDSYFCNSASNCNSIIDSAVKVGAKGGLGSAGGAASDSVGTIRYSGGSRGGRETYFDCGYGGGGGAGGPHGNGARGGNAFSDINTAVITGGGGGASGGGSQGGNGSITAGGRGGSNFFGNGGGSSGTAGTEGGGGGGGKNAGSPGSGGDGVDIISTVGSGGGGGGKSSCTPSAKGGNGGLYGGGGGGGGSALGAPGVIVIMYFPIAGVPFAPIIDAADGTTEIVLTWSTPSSDGGSAITGYKIYRGTSPSPTTLYTSVGVVNTYTDSAAVQGTTYYYRVKATNAIGDSVYSNEDSAVLTSSCPGGSNGGNVTGWAWSDTIGWISLNSGDADTCSSYTYGLSIDSSDNITGYAWSENIGWIKFGGLSSFPSGSGTVASNARVQGSTVFGWARACAGTVPGDCSSMTSRTDGWDGWISLSGTGYGVTANGSGLLGYAWGDTNVGWIDFSANYACAVSEGYYCDGDVRHYKNVSCDIDTVPGVPETCSYLCSPGACIPPPDPSGTLGNGVAITATPTFIRSDGIAHITWGTQYTTSCTVTGTNGDTWYPDTSGTQSSSPIQKTTTYTLSCVGSEGAALNQSVTVRVAPKFRER